jgi:glycosyltransferase involved in cell wall biosynthesis
VTWSPRAAGTIVLHVGYSQTLSFNAREQLKGLRDRGWHVHVACTADEWARRLHADGFEVHDVRLGYHPSLSEALAGGRDLVSCIRACRPQLVHTHNAHHGIVGRLIARGFGIPAVHTWRYNPIDASSSWLTALSYGTVEGVASRAGQAVLFQNAEDLRFGVESGIVPRGTAHLIGNGIAVDQYTRPQKSRNATRDALGVRRDAELLLCIARLDDRKGVPDLLKAFAQLAPRRPCLELVILGIGPLYERLAKEAAERGLSDRIHLLGQRDDVPDVLHAGDVLCLTSRREGVPRSVMEAMAARVPVVATDVVGTRAIVVDGETGLLVPLGEPASLAAAVNRLLDDPHLAARLTERGHALVASEWDQSLVVDRVADIYQLLLSNAAAPGRVSPTPAADELDS